MGLIRQFHSPKSVTFRDIRPFLHRRPFSVWTLPTSPPRQRRFVNPGAPVGLISRFHVRAWGALVRLRGLDAPYTHAFDFTHLAPNRWV